jgi:hypothetical protein
MSFVVTFFSMIAAWMAIAISMLWGMLRITRRPHPFAQNRTVAGVHYNENPSETSDMYPTTPDGRYFVVKGKLWRCSNPSLPDDVRQSLVDYLMAARREVKAAKASGDPRQLSVAKAKVHQAKIELGERGPVWWEDGSADVNQQQVTHTPYADWYLSIQHS